MRVLVACEESQAVCLAFRKYGAEAFSCDIQPCSGGHPEFHLQCDVREILNNSWDLVVAHPPCTYLARSGACCLFDFNGKIKNIERYKKGLAAREFFMLFYRLKVPYCIENPVPLKIYDLPAWSQIVNPFDFGDRFSKRTCLWLNDLPLLVSDYVRRPEFSLTDKYHDAKRRSKTSLELADAMAYYWTHFL